MVFWRLGDTEGCWGLGRKREAADLPSSSLSNYHTVILSNCQTIQKWNCLGVGKFDSLRVGELESLTVGGLGRQATLIFTLQLSYCPTIKLLARKGAEAPFSDIFPNLSASPSLSVLRVSPKA